MSNFIYIWESAYYYSIYLKWSIFVKFLKFIKKIKKPLFSINVSNSIYSEKVDFEHLEILQYLQGETKVFTLVMVK